jgi:hypothetical protein
VERVRAWASYLALLSVIPDILLSREKVGHSQTIGHGVINCYPQSVQKTVGRKQMKTKMAGLLLPLVAAVFVLAFAAPPVYPGAKAVDELNEAAKKAGQDSMAYNTLDSFEKVYEFYKTKGTEVQGAHRIGPREKFALIMFAETGYGVAIGWNEDSKSDGTVIHIGRRGPSR